MLGLDETEREIWSAALSVFHSNRSLIERERLATVVIIFRDLSWLRPVHAEQFA